MERFRNWMGTDLYIRRGTCIVLASSLIVGSIIAERAGVPKATEQAVIRTANLIGDMVDQGWYNTRRYGSDRLRDWSNWWNPGPRDLTPPRRPASLSTERV